jgi:NAD+ diphosphatase
MYPISHFHFCPRCGAPRSAPTASNSFECSHCQFCYYFNASAGVAVFIENALGQVLLIRRAKDPGINRLAPPGGFIDIGERAETALSREVAEEIGIQIHSIHFLCSQTNEYTYAGVTYPVLDLFFIAKSEASKLTLAPEEVRTADWYAPEDVCTDDLAFASMQAAWKEFLNCRLKFNESLGLPSANSAIGYGR